MIKIYHNSRCGKSRAGLAALESLNIPFETIKYLENPLTKAELVALLKKLNYQPIDLIRTKESIWIQEYKGKNLSDDAIIDAMITHPKLMERPIIVVNEKAVVARPADKIKEII
ncbi:arsenate reductase (glutaredoxin) [Flavobacterium sp.]|uniref:arsenate reductase (glutaredoxin) n=1 Tax=Flavobacterium sp. TaxID=239 RepID=UPI003F69B54D